MNMQVGLTGALPALSDTMQLLDVSFSQLTGTLPSEWQALRHVRWCALMVTCATLGAGC